MFDTTLLLNLVKGLVLGSSAALIGYVKSMPTGEEFDWKKFMPTVIIGGISGCVASIINIDLNSAQTLLGDYGVIAIVNTLWSAFLKQKEKLNLTKPQ